MKVLLYFEGIKYISKSGVGKALKHQQEALKLAGVEYTLNSDDDYDILHINTVYANSGYIISKARKKGAKVVYHAHSTMEDFKNSFLLSNTTANVFKKLLIYLYSKSDAIIAPTPYTKSLLESYGITVPIFAVSNGIDLNKFKKDQDKSKIFRKYFNIKDGEKVVVSSGLWIKRKGIIDFVEVAKFLPNIKFIWFGETPILSIPNEIRQIIKGEHPSNVIFAGYMTGDVYKGAFSGADAFFFPSYEENEGIVILEALASEQVAIVRDIPVYSSWLIDKVNCRKANNNYEFAKIIEETVYGNIESLTFNGHNVAKERSIYNIGFELKNIYEKVLNYNQVPNIVKIKNPLNIGLFTDTYYPDVNGVAISVETLRKALINNGHNVYVITPTEETKITGIVSDGGVIRIPGIKLKKLYGFRLSRPYSIKAKRILKTFKLDIVHIHTEFSMRLFASYIAQSFKLPIVYTYHTMYEDYTHYFSFRYFDKAAKKIVGWVSKIAGETCTEIIAPTIKTKHYLQGYGIKKPINIIPTGIELSAFSEKNVSKAQVNEFIDRFGIENKFRVIFLGRVAKEKNIECLISGIKLVSQYDKDIVLIIAGFGPWEQELMKFVEESGVSENVIFTGKLSHSNVPIAYHCADVFASASTSETQGITYVEAMASGLPIIGKRDECLQEILLEGENGYYFDNEQEFAQSVLKIKNLNLDDFNKMKKVAVEKSQEYSIDIFGKKVIDVYEKSIKDLKAKKTKNT